jgi:hypothetical protein
MTLRFSTSRAIGLAVALTLGSVATASAQQTRVPVRKETGPTQPAPSSGMPVTKETRPATPAPTTPEPTTPATPTTPDTMTTTSSSTPAVTTPVVTDTTTTSVTTTSTVTTESAGEVPMRSGMRWGNGFYVGLHGGTQFPQNEINNAYDPGYNVGGMLGWDAQNSPLGVRLNGSWNRLNGRTLSNTTIDDVSFTGAVPNADLYSAFADAKLRLPFGRFLGSTSGLYAVGGAGVTYFRNFDRFTTVTGNTANQSRTGTFNPEDVTRFAANLGGGVSWGLGNVSLFVESRWVRVFTQNRNTDYVPLTVGLTFH